MAKYRKVGQYDIYRKEKEPSNWGWWVVGIIGFIVAVGQCSNKAPEEIKNSTNNWQDNKEMLINTPEEAQDLCNQPVAKNTLELVL